MICLGIESTAHTFSVALVDDKGKILEEVRDTYKSKDGGIHPIETANHHRSVYGQMVEGVLKSRTPDLIAYSAGPGLGPCLAVGDEVAKGLVKKFNVSLVGVNHCVAHIEIARLTTGSKDPVTVYLSGGNTQILAYVNGRYRAVGETLDIAVGNALDKFARSAGISSAPQVENIALKGTKLLNLPYIVKGMDLSFSGLTTHCEKLLKTESLENICYSFQEHAFAMLTEVTERALAALNKDEVLLTGGVAANKRLQEMMRIMTEERGAKFWVVEPKYAGDNGAMIAWTGILMHKHGIKGLQDYEQRWRTDQVDIPWFNK